MQCSRLFSIWRQSLENAPEIWFIRHLGAGLLWRNKAARRWLNVSAGFTSWSSAIRWAHHADVDPIETAISNAAKLGIKTTAFARIKIQPHRFDTARCIFQHVHCGECRSNCGLVIYLAEPESPEPFP